MELEHRQAFVVSDLLGDKAGAHVATWLLCRELGRLGLKARCFAQHVSWSKADSEVGFEVERPRIGRGCRWDWPGRCLAWQAARAIESERPDWVFVVGVTPLARYLLRSPAAEQLLVWELTNATPDNKFVDAQARSLLGRCRAMLSPSNAIDQAIRKNHDYRGTLLRLPFWIEDEAAVPPNPPGEFLADFIYLGRRDPEKGLAGLVEAVALVASQHPKVRVLVAGAGPEEPFASMAAERGVAPNIRFQFFPSREETMTALSRCRCLVLPSYHEGYPLVLLEAAQRGVPFIATSVGSVPELYAGSPACELVPPRQMAPLAEAMLRVLNEAGDVLAARRTAARQIFERLSSSPVVREKLRALLDALEAR